MKMRKKEMNVSEKYTYMAHKILSSNYKNNSYYDTIKNLFLTWHKS